MFIIKFMDIDVATINIDTGEVNIIKSSMLPKDLKFSFNPIKNVLMFNKWCASRTLSLSRENVKRICNALCISQDSSDVYKSSIALLYRCLSLDDAYWVADIGNILKWEDVSLHSNKSRNVLTPVSLCGKVSTIFKRKLDNSCDLSVNGTFAKSWIREGNSLYLCKADASKSSNETISEIHASKLLKSIGANAVEYTLDYIDGTRVSKCKCFTSNSISFIPYKVFRQSYRGAINWIRKVFKEDYANMCVTNYIIGNEDLHDGNWGILLDNNSFNYIGLAPLFDFNYAMSEDSYIESKNNLFIPEIYYIDTNTGDVIHDSDNILDTEYIIKSSGSIEEIAIREFSDCTLNLRSIDCTGIQEDYIKEIEYRINKLLSSIK